MSTVGSYNRETKTLTHFKKKRGKNVKKISHFDNVHAIAMGARCSEALTGYGILRRGRKIRSFYLSLILMCERESMLSILLRESAWFNSKKITFFLGVNELLPTN